MTTSPQDPNHPDDSSPQAQGAPQAPDQQASQADSGAAGSQPGERFGSQPGDQYGSQPSQGSQPGDQYGSQPTEQYDSRPGPGDPHGGRYSNSQYDGSGQYGSQNPGYGQAGGYGQASGYDQTGGYGAPGPYGQAGTHGQNQPYGQNQNYGQAEHYGQYGQADAYAQTGRSTEPGFVKSLFDFRFDNFIAVRWAGIIYILAIIVAGLWWLGTILSAIGLGAAANTPTMFNPEPSFNAWPLVLAIIFGWIGPALWVIFVRLILELIVAGVKTAEHTKRIADSTGR